VDTGVSKQSNAGRSETMVGPSEVVVGHNIIHKVAPRYYRYAIQNLVEFGICMLT